MGDTERLSKLREPFGAEHVGLLPRVTCKDCSDRKVQCQKHQRQKCATCGAFVSTQHIHLDYVGHGAVTDRLLEVDPEWDWQPLAFDHNGLPLFTYDKNLNAVELWIRLTVCGVTRLGVGTCPSDQFDAPKVLIGDALRNAAMRFGVALDLWVKGHAEDSEQQSSGNTRGETAWEPPPAELLADFRDVAEALDDDNRKALKAWFAGHHVPAIDKCSLRQVADALAEAKRLERRHFDRGNAVNADAANEADRPAALEPKVLAIYAGKVFRDIDAPKGQKTRTVERLRHAVVWLSTDGRSCSLNDCATADLESVQSWLRDIDAGAITYRFDPADDAGVTFVVGDPVQPVEHTVLWSEFEQPELLDHDAETEVQAEAIKRTVKK